MSCKYWMYLSYLVAIAVCPSCCCNKPPCPQLTESDESWLPDKESDTLVFKNNSGKIFKVKAFNKFENNDYGNAKPSYGNNCYEYCTKQIEQNFNFAGGDSEEISIYYLLLKKDNVLNLKISQSNNSLTVYFSLDKAEKIDNIIIGGKSFKEVYFNILDTNNNQSKYYKYYVAKNYGLIRFENKNKEYYERVF